MPKKKHKTKKTIKDKLDLIFRKALEGKSINKDLEKYQVEQKIKDLKKVKGGKK